MNAEMVRKILRKKITSVAPVILGGNNLKITYLPKGTVTVLSRGSAPFIAIVLTSLPGEARLLWVEIEDRRTRETAASFRSSWR